jgi:hypothetical protein
VEKLRVIPPFEFENWAVIALGGIPNKVQVGDMGVDGRLFPVSSSAAPRKQQEGELGLKERWYPIRPQEIQLAQAQQKELAMSLQASRLRLDSLRLIWKGSAESLR